MLLIVKVAYSKTVKQNKIVSTKVLKNLKNLKEFHYYTIITHYAIAFCVETKETLIKLPKTNVRNCETLVELSRGLAE